VLREKVMECSEKVFYSSPIVTSMFFSTYFKEEITESSELSFLYYFDSNIVTEFLFEDALGVEEVSCDDLPKP
jgi:hypothetical protein